MSTPNAEYVRIAQQRHVLVGDLDALEYAIADYIAKWGEHLTGRPYQGEFGTNIAGIPCAAANMAMSVIRKNLVASWSESVAVSTDWRTKVDTGHTSHSCGCGHHWDTHMAVMGGCSSCSCNAHPPNQPPAHSDGSGAAT